MLKLARKEFSNLRSVSKRSPYIRSKYFKGSKVFLTVFWHHIMQKHRTNRMVRLRFYRVAIDLLENTRIPPETITSKAHKDILLHRFYGKTIEGELFCVQVKEDQRLKRKDFMSVFDVKPHK